MGAQRVFSPCAPWCRCLFVVSASQVLPGALACVASPNRAGAPGTGPKAPAGLLGLCGLGAPGPRPALPYLPILAASQVVGAGAGMGEASRASTPRASRSLSA